MYSSKVDFVAFDDVTLTRSKEVSNFVGDHFHAEKRQCELDSKNDVFERVLAILLILGLVLSSISKYCSEKPWRNSHREKATDTNFTATG